jgi:hypothetical protein
LNAIIGNTESLIEVVSAVVGDDLIQLFSEQSSLYCPQTLQQWKVSSESLKWSDIAPGEMKMV